VAGFDQQQVAVQVEGLLSRMADMGRSPRYVARLLSLAGAPVQPSGWAIITVLNREGPQRVSQLAELLNIDQSTVSRQLKPLDAAGLVDRKIAPDDRRSTIVASSKKGNRLYASVRERWLADLGWFIREWSAEEQRTLGDLAERFSAEIDLGRAQLQKHDAARDGAA
jgi:DNA-binding MarR family transcriptional regulator